MSGCRRLPWKILPIVALAAACGPGGGDGAGEGVRAEEAPGESAEAIAVKTALVRREPMSSVYSTSSTLRADKQATVLARTKGVIRRLEVEEGDRVGAGRTLAVLEDDEQRIEFERSRATLEIETREFDRAQSLHEDGLLSEEEYEASRREWEEAKHAAARAELELRRTVVRAPFTGWILTRHLDVGATVADGTPVYDLADLDPLYTDVNIPERHVATLEAGQRVRLLADASGETVPAGIERIAPAVDPSTGTVKVTLAVSGESSLRPGAFVRVEIITETHPDALVVPRSALVAEGRRWHLFRLEDGDDQVRQIEVDLGFEAGDRVEVVLVGAPESGLRPGDRVVVLGASALSDGAKVVVMDETEQAEEGEGAPA